MPPRWCAILLARIGRASGVSSRVFCRLLPANTTSQSMRPVSSPLAYSLYRPCRLHRPSDDCRRAGVMWRSLVALSRLVRGLRCGDRLLGLPVEHCGLDKNCVGHASGCGQRAFGAPGESLLPWREASWQGLFRLEHLAWAPHRLFPTAKVCSVKTVHFG